MSRALLRSVLDEGRDVLLERPLRHLMKSRGGSSSSRSFSSRSSPSTSSSRSAFSRSSNAARFGAGGVEGGSFDDEEDDNDWTWLYVLIAIIIVIGVIACLVNQIKKRNQALEQAANVKPPAGALVTASTAAPVPVQAQDPYSSSYKPDTVPGVPVGMACNPSQPQPSKTPAESSIPASQAPQGAPDLNPYTLYHPGSAPPVSPPAAPALPVYALYSAANATRPGPNAPTV